MAEFLLVSASTGVMKSLLRKLATMMSDEYKLHKDLRRDIEFLKDELAVMHAFLIRMADIEEPDEISKLRVSAVRELSYDIEDHVDKLMQLDDHESSSNDQGFRKLMNKSKKLIKDFKIRKSIGKEVKDIKHQVMEVSSRFGRYKMDEACCTTRKAVVDPRLVALFKDASELAGMDGPRDDLIKWLKNQEGDAAQPKVLAIVGAGGLGKTTLADQIYNKLRGNFDCHAFVSISRNPDLTKIFCSILSDIGGQETIPAEAPNLIKKIREILENKRYFIIIDDIWDTRIWEILEPAFFKNSCGSRIMVTTRINEVAKSCTSNREDLVYQIKPLGVADSRKLFFKRIFGCEEKCPPNLREASNEILRKCGGLPLAIITISSLLKTMKTDQWVRVQRSPGFGFDMGSKVDGMRGILGLSYFELPPHLRSCLLYLAQFPEDYVIQRYRVVQRWIAEGFIHCEDGQDLLEFGDLCFHDIINRSLVQPVDIAYDGTAMACRVHDTILDFLIQKSTEENFSTLLSSHSKVPPHPSHAKIRRLSLQENDSEEIVTISPELNTSHLRSLCVFGYNKQLSFIMNFSYLRVLDLEDCTELEDHHLINISRLSQLRYLNISYTGISAIPAEIGLLQYLEILLCKQERVWNNIGLQLPETVTQLARLVRLFVSSDTILPDGIGRWKSLQYLEVINPYRCSEKFLQEIGELIHLRYLSILWDQDYNEECNTEMLVSSLRKLDACNLRDLSLRFEFRDADDVPEGEFSFPALQSIRRLTLILMHDDIGISKFTKWLVSLANLEYLYICMDRIKWNGIKQQDLQLIGSISTLLYFGLSLIKTHGDHGPTIIRGGFRQLQRFSFESYEYEHGLMIQEGAMPKLRDIELSINSRYTTEEEVFDFGIQHLPCLSSIRVDAYDHKTTSSAEEVERAFKSLVETHANHPTLLVTPCLFGYEGSIKMGRRDSV